MNANDTAHSPPLIIGHRGASWDAPENTLAAFRLALAQGADGVEFDVRLARDGVPVVIHDATLKRTASIEGHVRDLTSAELRRLDAATWFNRLRPDLARDEYSREGVPTLDETLALLGPRSRVVYVEMKCEAEAEFAPLARAVVECVRLHKLESRAVVKCFRLRALAEVKSLAPELRTAALFARNASRPVTTARGLVAEALACGADEVSIQRTLLSRALVGAARARGLATLVWTVDDPKSLARAWDLGVRALFTNRPAPMRSALETLRARRAASADEL
jgi:glycerophosphoryl diester phosphodiesterase